MKHVATVAVLALSLMQPVLAQGPVPDTTSAWRYYPLQIGNVWEYRGFGLQPGDFRFEIVGDTAIAGTRYFVEAAASYSNGEWGPISSRPVRFDTTTANVLVRWDDGTESVWQLSRSCPLSVPFETAECPSGPVEVGGGYDEEFELFSGPTLSGVTLKSFYETTRSYFVAGIGWMGSDLVVEPGGTRLSYARIDGVEYGEPFPVATEGEPAEAAVTLSVFPNPTREAATVRFSLDRPQRVTLAVYDVLGREVVVLHDGPLSAGEHALAFDAARLRAGLYLVHVESGGQRFTERLTVVP